MREILKEREEQRRRVIEKLKEDVLRARERAGKMSAVLFGSYARGDFNLWSDVDIIVVTEAVRGVRFIERWKLFPELREYEAIFWTPEEADKLLKKPAWKKALGHKVVIVDDFGIFT
ncbi:MAG: nucleotidyltransferase domain-containing protein [Crenarchaeota archaeon]|nr:nucleotidyltransferase domain-containing protein [Thermoproteota archaeon]